MRLLHRGDPGWGPHHPVGADAITHSLPHDLVECATMWLIIGTPVLALSTHAVFH